MIRLGLRTRLATALIAVAVLAIGIATILGDIGLKPRLSNAARARLERSAAHFAEVASIAHLEAGSWPDAQPVLRHLAALDDLRAEVSIDGGIVARTGPLSGVRATARLNTGSRQLGTVTISPANGRLHTPEEQALRSSLDRLHLITGGIAIGAALLIAFLLAETLTRPLRRLRRTAERMERGELEARVTLAGDDEFAALARALNRLAETLAHEEEIRNASVADLGHELRTPVNALLARVEAAQDGVISRRENLDAMHTEVLRLMRLLDDLARLGDAERPGMLLHKHPVDLGEITRTVASSFAPPMAASDVELIVDTEPVRVLGDRGRLEQIASNLMTNAVRYTETGSIHVTVRDEGNAAVLEVADTGIGIAPEDLRNIFTRFWRGDRSRSRATGGTGIGLAIVRELVNAHDGRVEVDSTLGQGSRFRVVLPAAVGR